MTNLNLENIEWGEFLIGEEFNIESTISGIDKNKLTGVLGNHIYITRTENNNGIDNFIGVQEKYKKDRGNIITIGLDTQTVFYQVKEFYTGQNLQILTHKNLNRYTAQYLIPLFKKQLQKFSWGGNGATLGRLRKTKILLPKNSSGNPDWDFMENYMRDKEKQQLETALNYYKNKLGEEEAGNVSLEKCEWKEFEIENIFDIKIGKNIDGNKIDKNSGSTPYVTRKESNNGIDGYIDFDDNVYKNTSYPVLTIGNETAKPFVQNFSFFTGTKVNVLNSKNKLNVYILKFISRSLEMHKSKYSYSYTVNSTRLKKQKILLPVNNSLEPDWNFMEKYMKFQEQKLVKRYIDYAEMKLI